MALYKYSWTCCGQQTPPTLAVISANLHSLFLLMNINFYQTALGTVLSLKSQIRYSKVSSVCHSFVFVVQSDHLIKVIIWLGKLQLVTFMFIMWLSNSLGHMQMSMRNGVTPKLKLTPTLTLTLTLTDTEGAVLTLMLGYRSLYITWQQHHNCTIVCELSLRILHTTRFFHLNLELSLYHAVVKPRFLLLDCTTVMTGCPDWQVMGHAKEREQCGHRSKIKGHRLWRGPALTAA